MFIIKRVEKKGQIFPDQDFLEDYKDSDFGSMLSTLGVEAEIGCKVFTLGDSNISVEIIVTDEKGERGLELLKQCAKDLVEILKDATKTMSPAYQEFYNHFLEDFMRNGLVMPMQGKLL